MAWKSSLIFFQSLRNREREEKCCKQEEFIWAKTEGFTVGILSIVSNYHVNIVSSNMSIEASQ